MTTPNNKQAGEQTQHTPGPWRIRAVRGNAGASKNVWVQQELIGAVARIYAGARVLERPSPPIDEVNAIKDANARLIAAAPELLEVTKLARQYIQPGSAIVIEMLDAAIAKAEKRLS